MSITLGGWGWKAQDSLGKLGGYQKTFLCLVGLESSPWLKWMKPSKENGFRNTWMKMTDYGEESCMLVGGIPTWPGVVLGSLYRMGVTFGGRFWNSGPVSTSALAGNLGGETKLDFGVIFGLKKAV